MAQAEAEMAKECGTINHRFVSLSSQSQESHVPQANMCEKCGECMLIIEYECAVDGREYRSELCSLETLAWFVDFYGESPAARQRRQKEALKYLAERDCPAGGGGDEPI